MPTLRQMRIISTETRETLSGIKRRRDDDDANPPDAASASPFFLPITTPSALLARNPLHLSYAVDVPLETLKTIRGDAARALLSDPFAGHSRRPAQIAAVASRFCRGAPQWIVGSSSGLELCAHSLVAKHLVASDRLETGSEALDRLLAPHPSFVSAENLAALSFPVGVPERDTKQDDGRMGAGGIPLGMVTEFSGPSSCGKTQLSLSIAARSVVKHDLMRVVYVISGGQGKAVSRRLYSLCVEAGRRFGKEERDARILAEKALERVSVVCVSDAYSLLALLAKIEGEEIHCPHSNSFGTLLVIDSISGCIGHHLFGNSLTVGAALVNQVGLTLRRMARTLDCRFDTTPKEDADNESLWIHSPPRRFAVVVTNGSVANWSADGTSAALVNNDTHKPAMGRYWHVSDIGLWLEEDKSHSQSDGASFKLQDFYNETPVAGLYYASKKVVCATLTNHYAKSCVGKKNSMVKFVVRSGGVEDISV
ncbi:hypothetical protein ACHAW6_006292 [Cyclotella cf. meneghiniana]